MLTPADILFYLCGLGLLAGGGLVVFSRGSVLGVLGLIFACLNVSTLLVLMGADFLAMLFLMVYVGAVAVLFLFVVMMTAGVSPARKLSWRLLWRPVHWTVGLIALAWVLEMILAFYVRDTQALGMVQSTPLPGAEAIGQALFEDYAVVLEAVGMVLLVAMVGAVVLTHRPRPDAKRQNVTAQLRRRPQDTLRLHKVPVRTSVEKETPASEGGAE